MRFSILILISGILLLSACGEESGDPTFSFSRTVTPDARSSDGWGIDSVLALEPSLVERYDLVVGDGRACAYGARSGFAGVNYLSCWGRRIHPNDREQVSGNVDGGTKMLSIGEDHVCTTLTNFGGRRVHCDGSNSHGQNTDPGPLREDEVKRGHWLTNPNVVASGNQHNCALDLYSVYCWGNNNKGQTDVPVMRDVKWVAAGGDTSCAIDGNDDVFCWGSNEHEQVNVPSYLGSVSNLAVGEEFVCASNNLELLCWGDLSDWSFLDTFTKIIHISAGQDHACILDETQVEPRILEAKCFGRENGRNDLLAVPTAINTNIRTIAAGNGFTCASNMYSGYAWSPDEDALGNDIIDEITGELVYSQQDHKGILCWGKNDERQASAPKQLCLGYNNQAIDYDERTCPEY